MALATALVAAGLTAVVTFVPSVRFAYRSPTAHVALETAAGLMAAPAAYLVLARLGRRRRRTEPGPSGGRLWGRFRPRGDSGGVPAPAPWLADPVTHLPA